MSRELREEIERQDARLRAARDAVRLLEGELAAKGRHDSDQQAAFAREHAALLEEAERLRSRSDALKAERAALQARIEAGRAEFNRLRWNRAPGPRPAISISPEYPASELLEPTGWRRGQPWYVRVLYWLVKPPEWK